MPTNKLAKINFKSFEHDMSLKQLNMYIPFNMIVKPKMSMIAEIFSIHETKYIFWE